MRNDFAPTDLVPADRLRQLQRRTDAPGLRRLGMQAMAYVATAAGLTAADQPLHIALLVVANAFVQLGMFGMLHEAAHRTAFRTPWLNELAAWVAALAHPMTPALMRAFHFEHHRHTHELGSDPELAGFRWMAAWPRHVLWLAAVSGLPILGARVGWTLFAAVVPPGAVWSRVLPFVRADRRRRVAWEARALLAVHGTVVAAALTVLPGLLWLYAGLLGGHALTSIYTTCEHRGLPADGGTVLDRTRSLRAPAWLRWLLWNMPYHAEHHGWPSVPFHALGALSAEVSDALPHRAGVMELHVRRGRPAR